MKHYSLQIFSTALILSYGAFSYASENAAVVFPVEGNANCNTFAANQIVKQGSVAVTSETAYPGTVYQQNPQNNAPLATYSVSLDGNTASFSDAAMRIDFAILKSGGIGALIIYPSGGVVSDSGMQVKDTSGAIQPIEKISLCYGLSTGPVSSSPEFTTPTCESLNATGGIDGIEVMCPTELDPATGLPRRSIVAIFELDKPFYNTGGTPRACVCNGSALERCNPNVPFLEEEKDGVLVAVNNGACPKPAATGKSGVEVTTHVELNNDPYYCTTSGGIRTCFKY